ncbi:MAG: SMC family ATPase, partial [Defluviitaleaceae bacterium]|nr:SMC family ATPase [Defluviitaleaceae bacterium]
EKYKKLNEILLQLQEAQSQKLILDEAAPKIEQDKKVLEKARRAEKIRYPMESAKSLEDAVAQAQRALVAADNLAKQTEQSATKCTNEHAAARKVLNEELPILQKIFGLEEEREKLLSEHSDIKKSLRDVNEKLSELEIKNDKLAKGLEEIRQAKAAVYVDAGELKALNDGVQMEALLAGHLATKRKVEGLVAEIKQSLDEGSPCPVCGSENHSQHKHEGSISAVFQGIGNHDSELESKLAELRKSLNLSDSINFATAFELASEKMKKKADLETKEAALNAEQKAFGADLERLKAEKSHHEGAMENIMGRGKQKSAEIAALRAEGMPKSIADLQARIDDIVATERETDDLQKKYNAEYQEAAKSQALSKERFGQLSQDFEQQNADLQSLLREAGFESTQDATLALMDKSATDVLEQGITDFAQKCSQHKNNIENYENLLADADIKAIPSSLEKYHDEHERIEKDLIEKEKNAAVLAEKIQQMEENLKTLDGIILEKKALQKRQGHILDIEKLFKGNAFINYLAHRHLHAITAEASSRLKSMTAGRFAIEYDETNFLIRDDKNMGKYLPTAALSGGETFMVSLCLALSLANKIQMQKGAVLSFFFLDEGFGSLDKNALDVVITALESMACEHMTVGLISHVEELKHRIINKLEI